MANTPTVNVTRAKLYKMVSFKGTVKGGTKKYTALTVANEFGNLLEDQNKGFKALINGVNSLGASLNGISLQVMEMANVMKSKISSGIAAEALLEKTKQKEKKAENQRKKIAEAALKRKEAKEKRGEKEDESEKNEGKEKQSVAKTFRENTKKAFGGLFSGLVKIAGMLFKIFIAFGVLDWVSKNPDKVEKIAKGLFSLGKFFFNIAGFLAGNALDGLISFLENPISLKGFLGAVQFVLAAAPIFIGLAFLKNPLATAKAVGWVVSSLAKGILNIKAAALFGDKIKKFAGTKLGKVAFAGGAGIASFAASKASGADTGEALSAGVGGAAGFAAGAALGEATGIPGAGAIAGAAGAFVGSKAGGAIGGFMKPIFDPIGRFFNMVGKVFNDVLAPIKDGLSEFFEALGSVMNGVLDVVEPHLPLITNILGVGLKVMFAPLWLGIKALTTVLRFFAPKESDTPEKKDDAPGKSAGGKVRTSRRAAGGPVRSPKRVVPKMASGGSFNLQGEMQKQLQRTIKVSKAFGSLMLLPFKAMGIGILTAIGMIGKVFGKFLPAPLKTLMGAMIAPLANIFGIPMSVVGGSGGGEDVASEDKKDPAKLGKKMSWEDKIFEAIAGDDGTIALFGKLFEAITEHPIFKGVSAVASGFLGFLGFSEGGQVPQPFPSHRSPGRAGGGWISGPQSGYPVSLDGGASTSFIGHGTEWVGMKGFAGGGAFVVPFDTPATKQNPNLTSRRMGEASAGGYAMPFSVGGPVNQPIHHSFSVPRPFSVGGPVTSIAKMSLPKFSEGGELKPTGKFDPEGFAKNSFQANRVVLNDKSYYTTYAYDDKTKEVAIKSMSKRTKAANLFGQGEERVPIQPGSPEFESVMKSGGLKLDIQERHGKRGLQGEKSLANITKINVHPEAERAFYYRKSFKDHKEEWLKKGVSEDKANQLAASAAATGVQIDPKKKQSVKAGVEDNPYSAPASMENNVVTAKDREEAKKEDGEKEDPIAAFKKNLIKLSEDFAKVKAMPANSASSSGAKIEESKQKETTDRNARLEAMVSERDVTMAPIIKESQAPPVGGGDATPILIPNHGGNDADDWLLPKFGLVSEFSQDLVDFM
jgi:hypothetical protein